MWQEITIPNAMGQGLEIVNKFNNGQLARQA